VNTLLLWEYGKPSGIIVMGEISYLTIHELPAIGSEAFIHHGEFASTRANTAWLHGYINSTLDQQAASYNNEKH